MSNNTIATCDVRGSPLIFKAAHRLMKANEKTEKSSANRRPPLSAITASSGRVNLSDISGSKNSANQPTDVPTVASSSKSNKANSSKTLTVASARKSIKPRQRLFQKCLYQKPPNALKTE
jgi:hypothetical protein